MDSRKYLEDYCQGRLNLTNINNILINHREVDYYEKLAEYLTKKEIPQKMGIQTKNKMMISSLFLHSYLDEEILDRIIPNKIEHDEFGEGSIEGRDCEYVSYFTKINGILIHIGFDHRGTCIEIERSTSPKETFNALKVLVDLVMF